MCLMKSMLPKKYSRWLTIPAASYTQAPIHLPACVLASLRASISWTSASVAPSFAVITSAQIEYIIQQKKIYQWRLYIQQDYFDNIL